MFQQLREKMQSERGVSLLYALMFFLVASMVAVAIVSAALSAAERVNNDRKTQQDYLTLTSAGELVSGILESSNDAPFFCTISGEKIAGSVDEYEIKTVEAEEGPLQDMIQKAVEEASGLPTLNNVAGIPRESEIKFEVTLPSNSGLGDLSGTVVNVRGWMQIGTLSEVLSSEISDSSGTGAFLIKVELSIDGSAQKLFLRAPCTPKKRGEAEAELHWYKENSTLTTKYEEVFEA